MSTQVFSLQFTRKSLQICSPQEIKAKASSAFQRNMLLAWSQTKKVALGRQGGYHVALCNSCVTCMRAGQTSLYKLNLQLMLSHFPVIKQYPILRHKFRKNPKHLFDIRQTAATLSHLLIQITVECEIKHVLALTHLVYSSGEVLILPRYRWCSPERCSRRLMCVFTVLLQWLVDTALSTVSASGLHFDWDVCRTAFLELLYGS